MCSCFKKSCGSVSSQTEQSQQRDFKHPLLIYPQEINNKNLSTIRMKVSYLA